MKLRWLEVLSMWTNYLSDGHLDVNQKEKKIWLVRLLNDLMNFGACVGIVFGWIATSRTLGDELIQESR